MAASSVDGATTLSGRSGMRRWRSVSVTVSHRVIQELLSESQFGRARTSFGSLASLASLASSNSAACRFQKLQQLESK